MARIRLTDADFRPRAANRERVAPKTAANRARRLGTAGAYNRPQHGHGHSNSLSRC